jgi:hypothetical protein
MVEMSDVLGVSGVQGANRSKALYEAIDFDPNKFQTEETNKAEIREMGASRNPSKLEGIGAIQIPTEASTNAVVPPEIGKGTLINSVV